MDKHEKQRWVNITSGLIKKITIGSDHKFIGGGKRCETCNKMFGDNNYLRFVATKYCGSCEFKQYKHLDFFNAFTVEGRRTGYNNMIAGDSKHRKKSGKPTKNVDAT